MPNVNLTSSLRAEYQQLFDTCLINSNRAADVDSIASRIEANKARYVAVGANQIPWYFIGVIHNMESSLNFTRHLHNGDPLTRRTVQVPAGRPKTGTPPFTWEESAADALGIKRLFDWTDWTIPGILYKLEQFNGWGYRLYHPSVKSPYLWSFSNQYVRGKYVADGTWSSTAVSSQCGAAVLLRRLAEREAIRFDNAGTPVVDNSVAVPTPVTSPAGPLVVYAPTKVSDVVTQFQTALNQMPGIFLKVDGRAGKRTSDAVKTVIGSYLIGDPRG